MDKKKISVILALLLAFLAVFIVKNYLDKKEQKYIDKEKKAYVVVAKTNIPTGTVVDASMLQIVPIPEQYVQPKTTNSMDAIIGKRVMADVFAGEQIMASKLTITVKDSSLAMRTPQGKRAVTVTIPVLSAVGGKIRPGDYVDVIGTFPYNQTVEGKVVTELVSVTLFQNILVLGIDGLSAEAAAARGQQPAAPAKSELVVTLAFSPREISFLSYALDHGKLRLVLRPPLETVVEPVPPVEQNALWQYVFSSLGQDFLKAPEETVLNKKEEKKEEPAPAPAPPTLEVYRGTEKSKMIMR